MKICIASSINPESRASEGRGKGDQVPPGFWKFYQKKVEKNKFHHFWPHPGKILENPLVPSAEEILPTPMSWMLYGKIKGGCF